MLIESIIRAKNCFRDYLLEMPKDLNSVVTDLQKTGVDDVVIKVAKVETQQGLEISTTIDLGQRQVCLYPGIPVSGKRIYEVYSTFVSFQGDGFHVMDNAASSKATADIQANKAKDYLGEKGITATIEQIDI